MILRLSRIHLLSGAALCVWAAFAAGDDQAKFLPAGPGKELVVRVCTDCHGVDSIRKKRVTADEWADVVANMVDNGAKADDAEQAAIVAYLAKNYGPDSKVYINSAHLPELKAVLGFTNQEAQAVMAYHDEHGDFKTWRDLLQVPGLDAQKVEAKKDLLAF